MAAVTAAVEAAKARAIKRPVSSGVIANPHEETVAQVKRSMKRFRSVEEMGENHAGEQCR